MFVQPFVSYTTSAALTVSTNLEATANWNAAGNRRWTAPLNVQIGKLATFGPLPANYALAYGMVSLQFDVYDRTAALRQTAGGEPVARLNARLNAASDS